jgi:Uncharacterised BCR, YnfA/UPF0060 family
VRLCSRRRLFALTVGCSENERTAQSVATCPPVLILKTFGLFVITAIVEIVGCYLPYLWLKKNGSPWLLIPALAKPGAVRVAPRAASNGIRARVCGLRWRLCRGRDGGSTAFP